MSIRNWVRSGKLTQAPKTPRRPMLRMEHLEDRITPATRTWDGGGGADINWSNAANWVGGILPANNDNIVFPAGLTSPTNSNVDIPNLTIGSLSLRNVGENTVNIPTGSFLTLNGSMPNGGNNNIESFAGLNGTHIITGGSLVLTGASPALTVSDGTLDIQIGIGSVADSTLRIFGNPEGRLFLSGANTPTVKTEVLSGRLHAGGLNTSTSTVSDVIFRDGSLFEVALPAVRFSQTLFDRLDVIGTVTINSGAILNIFDSPPAIGPFTIINNDGTDRISGTFNGLPEGATVMGVNNGKPFRISYVGGDGNDVVVTADGSISPLLVTGPTNGSGQLFQSPGGGTYTTPGTPFMSSIPGFTGEIRVALADINRDGIPDGVVATGPGGNRVRVISGAPGNAVLADFRVFDGFAGGLYVAAGDLNGDGFADVAVTGDGVDAFSGPVANGLGVRVYSGISITGGTTSPVVMASFSGLASLSGAQGEGALVKLGGRPAIADVNGDARPDLLIAAGTGGGPRVCVWNGTGFAGAAGGKPTVNPIINMFVFESTQRGGAFVTSGDLTGDGLADIAVGGGPGGGPRVRIVNSNFLLRLPNLEGVNLDDPANLTSGLVLNNYFAGSGSNRGGVRVAFRDLEGDGRADLVTGSGTNERSSVRLYGAASLTAAVGTSNEPASPQVFDPFGAVIPGGVWIG